MGRARARPSLSPFSVWLSLSLTDSGPFVLLFVCLCVVVHFGSWSLYVCGSRLDTMGLVSRWGGFASFLNPQLKVNLDIYDVYMKLSLHIKRQKWCIIHSWIIRFNSIFQQILLNNLLLRIRNESTQYKLKANFSDRVRIPLFWLTPDKNTISSAFTFQFVPRVL